MEGAVSSSADGAATAAVAQLSLSERASSDEENNDDDDGSWCSETDSADENASSDDNASPEENESPDESGAAGAKPAEPSAAAASGPPSGSRAPGEHAAAAAAAVPGNPAAVAVLATAAKALGVAAATAEPLESAAAVALGASAAAAKVPRVRRALGVSYAKVSKLAQARVDLPPPKVGNGHAVAAHAPEARDDSSSSGSGSEAATSSDEDQPTRGSGRRGAAAKSVLASSSTGGSHAARAAANGTAPAAGGPPLRSAMRINKERRAGGGGASSHRPSHRTDRKELNVSDGAVGGFTEPMALNIRLRKRPFTLLSRPRAEPPGNKPPVCSQKRQFVTFRKRHSVRDVKFDRDGTILLSTRRSVQRYDANGHYVEQLFVDRIVEPFGLWVSASGHVLVADHREGVVKEFGSGATSSSSSSPLVRSYGPVCSPRGVAQSSTGYVAVCAGEGPSVASRCVAVFHRHGQLHAVLGEGKLRMPTHITLTDSLVVVSDHARIVGFDTTGRRAFVYGGGTWNDYPAGLSADSDGFIIATDYFQNAVCALRKDRDRADIVMDAMHGLRHPTIVARCPFGHLLAVGEKHSSGYVIKIFKLVTEGTVEKSGKCP